jgi:hypothetical protein
MIGRAQKGHNLTLLKRKSPLPRPGIEPGLEVPETSVMSFSLPGRSLADLINTSGSGAGQARLRQMSMRSAFASACARGGAHR